MGLNFQPPEWLLQEYMNRKDPTQVASDGIGSALQAYAQVKQKQKELASLEAQRKATEFKAVADYIPEDQIPAVARQYGINIPQAAQQTPALVSPIDSPSPEPEANFSPQTGGAATVSPDGSPIINHWNAVMGQRSNPAGVTPGGLPPATLPTSKAGIAKRKSRLEMAKLEQGMDANEPASFDEVRIAFKAAGKPELAEDLIKNASALGQNTVQRKSMDSAIRGLGVAATGIRGNAFDDANEIRRQQMHLKMAEDYEKAVNPATASGGSLLSIAGKANARADRALQVLRNPKMTYQDLSTVISDISGIFQGGVPHEQSMRDQKYGTVMERLASIGTGLTGKPMEGMVAPELRQKLSEVIRDVKRVDNKVIEDNLLSKRSVHGGMAWAKENPQAMKEIEDNVRRQYIAAGEEGGGDTVTIRDSQGGMHTLPSANLEAAKKRDPGLTVIP